jgi:hypothetical protein
MENDREKFVRLANARVNRAIKDIQLIGNLSNKSNYAYTDADVEKIFRALSEEMKNCRRKFDANPAARHQAFVLGE